jgi:hypothetical protein
MRQFTSRPKLGFFAALVLTVAAFTIAFSSASEAATPLAHGIPRFAPSGPTGGPAPTSLSVSDSSGTYGGTTSLNATLTDESGYGVYGETVEFYVDGTDVGGATTDGNGYAELDNVSLSGIDAGSYFSGIYAVFNGDTDFDYSDGYGSLYIDKADQTLVITQDAPSDATYGDQFTVAADGGGSTSPVTYSSSGSCTNIGGDFTMTGSGQCTVYFDQYGDQNYNDAPEQTEYVNGSKADQTIQINSGAPASAAYGDQFSVSASGGGSNNPIDYGSSGGCTNSGTDYTMTSGNTDCIVTYDQAGDDNYNAANQVVEYVTAEKADQTIDVTQDAPGTAAYNSSFDVSANADGGPVSYSSGGVCSNVDGTFTMSSGTGTCVVYFDQAGDDNYNPAPEVTQYVYATTLDQNIDFAQPSDATYGDPDLDPGATASSGYAVTYSTSGVCTVVGGLIHYTGAGDCTIYADQSGDEYYNAAPEVEHTLYVNPASLDITADNQSKFYGQTASLGSTAFQASGLVGTDTIDSVTLSSDGTPAGAAPGNYEIVPSDAVAGQGTDLSNYSINYYDGTLSVLPAGLVGLNGVSVVTTGGRINAYRPALGEYDDQSPIKASIFSNGPIWVGGVIIRGNLQSTQDSIFAGKLARVRGDATAATTISHKKRIFGAKTEFAPTQPLEAPPLESCFDYSSPQSLLAGSSAKFSYSPQTGDLLVKKGAVTLPFETYCFHNITLWRGTTLRVTHPTTVQLSGKLAGRVGHLVNTTHVPDNLAIVSTYDGPAGVTVKGGYMAVVAPSTTVSIVGGTFFGTAYAWRLRIIGTGTRVHEAMPESN